MKRLLGSKWPDDSGLVEHGDYDEVMKFLSEMFEEVVDHYAENEEEREMWRELWPFDFRP